MPAPFAGDRVRSARRLSGLTQRQLADAAGFAQSFVSDVERSVESATDPFLTAVAAATHTPLSFFDAEPVHLPDGSLRHRKRSDATQIKRVQVLYEEVYRVTAGLVADANYRLPNLPVATEPTLTSDEIERYAEDARAALNLSTDAPIPNVTRALERGGVAIAPLAVPDARDGSAAEDIVLKGHQGLSAPTGTGTAQVIGVFAGLPGDRLRFTLAHELGHLVLHSNRWDVDEKTAELEAHLFAGAFLMPAVSADGAFAGTLTLRHFARLKATWGIAIQALIMRAHQRGALTDERKTSLFRQVSVRGWRVNEPVSVGIESPALLKQLIERRYPGESVQRVADHVGLPPLVLRSLVPATSKSKQHEPEGVVHQLR